MAYVAPTAANVQTRFPEFAAVDTDRIDLALEEAARFVDDTWIEADRFVAIQYLAAHILASNGALHPEGLSSVGAVSGPISSESLGDASVSYASRSQSTSDEDLRSTPWGERFIRIRRSNFRGPVML